MKRRLWIALALLLAGFVSLRAADSKEIGFDIRRGFSFVAKKVTPAVVFIQVEKTIQAPQGPASPFFFNDPADLFGEEFSERFFRQPQPRSFRAPPGRGPRGFMQVGQGSGFIVSKDGYILTNTHVIDDADKIRVRLNNGREYTAKRIGADPRTEVAVIKIDGQDLPFVEIGEVSKLETGDWVIAIGNPFGLAETLTVGVVSAKGRSNIGIADYEDFIQTDAAINPGNSGGPLLNIAGEVVGMNTAIFSRSGGYMGIGFAVPIDMAISVKEQLVKTGKVTRGYIGVMLNPGDVSEEMAKSLGLQSAGGALIADVVEKGPAAEAGIRGGDVIMELEGRKVPDSRFLRNEVARIAPGTKVKVVVAREGGPQTCNVKVAAFPEDGKAAEAESASDDHAPALAEKLGLQVQDLTADLAKRFGYEARQGVIVIEVADGSPAAREGLQPGNLIISVNRKDVASVQEFDKAVKTSAKGKLLLRVRSPQGVRFVLLSAEE
ncbi:MAG: DegQ family serine endoprotease [Kiritimatiellia bacterium]